MPDTKYSSNRDNFRILLNYSSHSTMSQKISSNTHNILAKVPRKKPKQFFWILYFKTHKQFWKKGKLWSLSKKLIYVQLQLLNSSWVMD